MSNPSDVALSHLKKLLSRDPMLRDLMANALPSASQGPGFHPDVDVFENPKAHILQCDLPGVVREDVRIRLEGARLVIEGERRSAQPEGSRPRAVERGHGTFRREFLLPTDVDAEGVKASLEEGVLTVTVPRVGGGARDIPIGS